MKEDAQQEKSMKFKKERKKERTSWQKDRKGEGGLEEEIT